MLDVVIDLTFFYCLWFLHILVYIIVLDTLTCPHEEKKCSKNVQRIYKCVSIFPIFFFSLSLHSMGGCIHPIWGSPPPPPIPS